MMARMTPVSLHFSDVPTGWEKNLYRQTTVGYWFCMFVTNNLSRRTVLQINSHQLHSVPCAARYASLPAPTCCFQAKVGTMMLQMPLLLLQQSGYCGRSLSGHLHGHDLSSTISVNAERSSSQSAGCVYSRFTMQSLQCPQI